MVCCFLSERERELERERWMDSKRWGGIGKIIIGILGRELNLKVGILVCYTLCVSVHGEFNTPQLNSVIT